MLPYQENFITLCLKYNVLKFGQFTLKSGRVSPYFFNAGEFNDGQARTQLSFAYASAIQQNFDAQYDLIFGPAYKGIPLAACTVMALNQQFQKNVPVTFNRKEAKDHGEGGVIIGASLKGKRVLLIDDVMTAGTALRHSAELIAAEGGVVSGVVIALNRQEKIGDANQSAVQEMEAHYGIRIASIIDAYTLLEYLEKNNPADPNVHTMRAHIEAYGIKQQA